MSMQFFGRYAAPEMVALSLVEMILTFSLTLVLLTPTAGAFSVSFVNPAIICALTVGFIAFVIGLYRPQMFVRARGLILNTLLSAVLSFPAIWIISKICGLNTLWPVGYDPLRPIKIVAIWCAGVICIRLIFLVAARCNLFLHRVAVVGPAEQANVSAAFPSRKRFLEISPVRPERASASTLKAQQIRTLIFVDGSEDTIPPGIAAEYKRLGISIQNQAEFCERHLRRVEITCLNGEWFDGLNDVGAHRSTASLTRAFDLALSLCLLLATLPLMSIVATLVRLDSPGPVLYRQERLGLHNKPFTVLKFRSMRVNAEASGPSWAQQKDPRVTRIGAIMRKTRIDELPQLVNILRGEMSFIGPRPERPHFVDQLKDVIPFYEERARVKPGLTGWAQVNYPYGASIEDARAKLSYDLYYVKYRSFLLDILILLSTVRVIMFQEGAR